MKSVAILIGNITLGNGTERAVSNLANSLSLYGDYFVHIISCCSEQGSSPYFILNDKIIVHHIGITLSNKFNYFQLRRKVINICKNNKIDFLLGTTHSLNSILVGINILGLKTIACEHMNYFATPWYSRLIRRFAYKKLDAVVLLTEKDRKHYSFCDHTFVIPNCVPQQVNSSTCDNKVILAVGRYTKQKGFDMLIQAFSLIHERIPDWKLRIVGQGEDEYLLKKLIVNYNLSDSIDLIPPTKAISKEYINAGIFALSSRWEGFVLVLTEAKSFGLPSVSFDCPEGPSDIIIDKVDGFLVPPNDIKEFSQKLLKLAVDADLRKKFGIAAKEDIKRLSPIGVFEKWNSLFCNL